MNRVAGLGRAGYVCEVLAGGGPLVVVLTGRKLTAAELLAIGGPRRHDGGRVMAEPGRAAARLPLPCPVNGHGSACPAPVIWFTAACLCERHPRGVMSPHPRFA
jgi:hypothetical protein